MEDPIWILISRRPLITFWHLITEILMSVKDECRCDDNLLPHSTDTLAVYRMVMSPTMHGEEQHRAHDLPAQMDVMFKSTPKAREWLL